MLPFTMIPGTATGLAKHATPNSMLLRSYSAPSSPNRTGHRAAAGVFPGVEAFINITLDHIVT
jgi:hypothetical protein